MGRLRRLRNAMLSHWQLFMAVAVVGIALIALKFSAEKRTRTQSDSRVRDR